MYSAYGLVTFRFTIPLPLGAGEQGVLGVYFNGGRKPQDGTLNLTGKNLNAVEPLLTLSRCLSPSCQDKTLLDELNAPQVQAMTGWVDVDSGNDRVSLCLHIKAQDASAHPDLATVEIFLDQVEATFEEQIDV